MKKIVMYLGVIAFFVACGDSDTEDFDPTRIDIVTGMQLVDAQATAIELWGNPNTPFVRRAVVFPKPATDVIRVQTSTSIKNIWLVAGFPTRRFFDTNFQEVFAQSSYDVGEVALSAIRALENLDQTDITLNLEGLSQGYYRMFVQFQDDSITWDNFYVGVSTSGNLEDINFWND
jgi:hypothetical protein